jgi:hypothetical protein
MNVTHIDITTGQVTTGHCFVQMKNRRTHAVSWLRWEGDSSKDKSEALVLDNTAQAEGMIAELRIHQPEFKCRVIPASGIDLFKGLALRDSHIMSY